MLGKAEKKVQGGKLVKARVQFTDKIEYVKILGDFFMHPEEAILEIEKCLIGAKTTDSTEKLEELLQAAIKAHNIQLLGVNARDIAETVKQAVSK